MKLSIVFVFIVIFSGCFQRKQTTLHWAGSLRRDSIVEKVVIPPCLSEEWYSKPYYFKLENMDNEKAIIESIVDYWVKSRYKDFDSSYIKEFERLERVNIEGFGESQIYQLSYSRHLPSMAPKKEIVVAQYSRREAVLFPIDKYYLVKKTTSSTGYAIGGIIPSKATGHFVVYFFTEDNRFNLIFDTMSDCICPRGGIPVTNYSLDCHCYRPFELKFSNDDVDSDGLLDLKFSGEILSFCENGENGYGRNDREPKDSTPVELVFYAKNTTFNYPLWEFRDTCLCNKMKF